ncbi:MAG: hypothetical protein JXR53_11620 [Bacteroidales bacterium]|nr:hypothetical protein [Bacteroidales bacterium]
MAEFESKSVLLKEQQQNVNEFLSDFRNFSELMPENVKDWQADEDSCSFTAEGAGQVKLKYTERSPEYIEIQPDMAIPVSGEIKLFVKLKDKGAECKATVGVEATIPPMFRMMLKRPLQNLLEMLATALEKHYNG